MCAIAAELSKLVTCLRKSSNRPGPRGFGSPSTDLFHRNTIRPGSANGSGLSSAALTTLKMAVLAPMPSASVRTATAENPGDFLSPRIAYAASCFESLQIALAMERLTDGRPGGWPEQSLLSLIDRDPRSLVQERRHLLSERRDLHR